MNLCFQAKRAKKMDSKEKREKEKEREAVNFQISRQMTENNNGEMEKKMDILLTKVFDTDSLKIVSIHDYLLWCCRYALYGVI